MVWVQRSRDHVYEVIDVSVSGVPIASSIRHIRHAADGMAAWSLDICTRSW